MPQGHRVLAKSASMTAWLRGLIISSTILLLSFWGSDQSQSLLKKKFYSSVRLVPKDCCCHEGYVYCIQIILNAISVNLREFKVSRSAE